MPNGSATPQTTDSRRRALGRAGLFAIASCALGWSSGAQAQAGATPLSPGAGALIVEPSRQLPAPPIPGPAPKAAPTVEIGGQSAPATPLREIRLSGPGRLSGRMAAITARFAGRPMDAATIKAAADAVSQAYADSGLALYTVAVPRQDLSKGVLTLVAVEGYIAQVNIDGDPRAAHDKLLLAYAAKLKAQRPLMRSTLERYLSLMRDIPGMTVDAKLFNSPSPGAVLLNLTVKRKRLQPDLAINNQGPEQLGAIQALASLAVNGLGAGDQARLTVSVPDDLQRFAYLGGSYIAPVGADGMIVRLDAGYMHTRPDQPPIDGTAASLGVQLAYPILRSYTRNLTLSGGLDGLNNDDALYGESLTSDHTRALRAGLSYGQTAERRTLSISAIGSAGVGILGARADTRITDADFRKVVIQLAVNQMVGSQFALRLKGLAQLSDGRLPVAEQLPLGGQAYVRAFAPGVVLGDYGHAESAEIAWINARPWPAPLKGSEIYGFVDEGHTWSRDRAPYIAAQHYALASTGAGVRFLINGKTMIGLEAAKAVDAPFPGENKPWRINVSWRITR